MSIVKDEAILIAPETLGELFGRDLAGWQITPGYFMEIKHGCMGRFPALLSDKDKKGENVIVFVIDKPLLRMVWDNIEREFAKVTTLMVLANPELGIAFSISGDEQQQKKMLPLRLFSEQELVELCKKDNPFRWAAGIMSLKNPENATPPDFS